MKEADFWPSCLRTSETTRNGVLLGFSRFWYLCAMLWSFLTCFSHIDYKEDTIYEK